MTGDTTTTAQPHPVLTRAARRTAITLALWIAALAILAVTMAMTGDASGHPFTPIDIGTGVAAQ